MKVIAALLISLLLLLLPGCSGEPGSGNSLTTEDYQLEAVSQDLVSANNGFAFAVFKTLNEEEKQENLFISPFSIATALTMTYNGARGTTREAMARTLGYDSLELEAINKSYLNLLSYLGGTDPKIRLNIANSLWIREGAPIKEDFIDRNQEYFQAQVEALDFSKAAAVEQINNWISQATQGKIQRMLEPPIPPDVVLYLINAIYFKGQWAGPFDPERTFDADFTTGSGEKATVKMMTRRGKAGYLEAEGYKAAKLPYGGGKMAMYCLLPDEGTEINELAAQLDAQEWDKIRREIAEMEDVLLQMPRFKVEYGIKNLNDALKALGMEEAFGGTADFSGMGEGLYISRVLHKAVIEVNEEGSEAAGATVVEMRETAALEPARFIADRPFLFIIAEEETGSILFMGKLFEL
ncbi:MAG TPA: serpin family protein [Bacillota bacterium]|nr:serpin family protein [Bacillota bacterium]